MRAREGKIDIHDYRKVKRHRSKNDTKPLFYQIPNALNSRVISVLTNEANRNNMNSNTEHGLSESKCFCFNAAISFGEDLEPEIIQVNSLIQGLSWESLSESVRNASVALIKIAIQEMTKLNGDYSNRVSWIAFELIRIPLKGRNIKVPALQWHRDPGYFDDLMDETSYYADYTSIFMLTDSDSWKGGHLEIQKNGANRHEKPPVSKTSGNTDRIKYRYNDVVTFYNKDSRHRVTQIESNSNSQDRIIFTCSIYGKHETDAYCKYRGIE